MLETPIRVQEGGGKKVAWAGFGKEEVVGLFMPEKSEIQKASRQIGQGCASVLMKP